MQSPAAFIAMSVLALGVTGSASAQDLLAARIGVGSILRIDGRIDPEMSRSALAAGALDLWPVAPVGIRVSFVAGVVDYAYRGIRFDEDPQTAEPRRIDMGAEGLAATSLAAVVRRPAGRFRPYALAGIGYSYFRPWARHDDHADRLSWDFGVGIATELGGRSWFLEMTPRIQGPNGGFLAGGWSYAPITLGLTF